MSVPDLPVTVQVHVILPENVPVLSAASVKVFSLVYDPMISPVMTPCCVTLKILLDPSCRVAVVVLFNVVAVPFAGKGCEVAAAALAVALA